MRGSMPSIASPGNGEARSSGCGTVKEAAVRAAMSRSVMPTKRKAHTRKAMAETQRRLRVAEVGRCNQPASRRHWSRERRLEFQTINEQNQETSF